MPAECMSLVVAVLTFPFLETNDAVGGELKANRSVGLRSAPQCRLQYHSELGSNPNLNANYIPETKVFIGCRFEP
jgi:hypothetical protein